VVTLPGFCVYGSSTLSFNLDLRRRDWRLVERDADTVEPCLILVDRASISTGEWFNLLNIPLTERNRVLLCGVARIAERGRLLRLGFGDLAAPDASLDEIEVRGTRVLQRQDHGRLKIALGPLTLNLAVRDGFVAGRRLALHPREFGLLWRLAQMPGQRVSQESLLADVWHLAFQPETNSLAVHVSRTRAKLRHAGLDGILMAIDHGYVLNWPDRTVEIQAGLDEPALIGEDLLIVGEDPSRCAKSLNTMTALPLP
jgi:two-component system, OmpR family, response regulator